MDFAWVVDALRRGLKVTRKDWLLAIPPMYLYMMTEKKPDGKRIIKMYPGTGPDFEWTHCGRLGRIRGTQEETCSRVYQSII